MSDKVVRLENFTRLYKDIYKWIEEYNILIDFNSDKEWIKSKNITATLIPRSEDILIVKKRDKGGYYSVSNNDGSVKYITNIRKRYEYLTKELMREYSSHFESQYGQISRDTNISLSNIKFDCLVDNGPGRKYYDNPFVHEMLPSKDKEKEMYPFFLEMRIGGGIELYNKETRELKYICNIGGRYEYIFKGEYKGLLSHLGGNVSVIIQLIPDKDDVWVRRHIEMNEDNNPYITRKRPDGGVDILSKDDGKLKYICNIGKRFYYIEKW
jgi:hypothetical protein